MSTAFDAYATVKRLLASGMPEAQAEAVVESLREWESRQDARVATKGDIHELKNCLDKHLDQFEIRIIKWMIGIALTVIGINAAFSITIISMLFSLLQAA